jgi:lipopolysaccharide export system permease protein
MRDILDDARSDLVATLVRPGAFNHPAGGITVYAQSVDESGVIHNLFIDRRLPDGRDTTITAREGRLQRRQAAPMLTLRDGVNEELSPTGNLTFLSFDNYVLDLRPFMQMKPQVRYKLSDRYLHELIFPVTESAWERDNALSMLAEGHSRIAMSLYPMAFMLLALAAVMGGPFDRLGYGGRIAVAGVAAVVTRVAGLGVQTLAGANAWLNLAQYAVPILLAAVSAWLLFRARESWSPSPTNARPLPFRSAHSPTAGVS